MKKLYSFSMLTLALVTTQLMSAQTFMADGVNYNVLSQEDLTCEVTKLSVGKYTGTVVVPETVENEGVKYTVVAVGNDAFKSNTTLKSVTLPNTVTAIGDYSFYECTAMTEFNVPTQLVTIGRYGFWCCTKLTSFPLPDTLEEIGEQGMRGMIGLTELTLPASLKKIGYNGVYNCNKLTTLTMGASVVEYMAYCFEKCSALKVINIVSMENLCASKFGNKVANPIYNAGTIYIDGQKVEDLVIPEGVETVAGSLFHSCNFKSVTLPSTIKEVGGTSFFACYDIAAVTCNAVVPPTIYDSTFSTSINGTATLTVPAGSEEAYKADKFWSRFTNVKSNDTSAIEDVEAADNAPAVYYNLQGVEVANPANGIFIRRQGNTVTKVAL